VTWSAVETLRQWHCWCGYTNVGFDPCAGCHRPAPRQVRRNTRARPTPAGQTALAAELLARAPTEAPGSPSPAWLTTLVVWSAVSMAVIVATLLLLA
jgi:hypothetical protein